ncbi:EF-P beta-lysylation protein EpmB [Pseudomonadales bacterium]|nr:EF-P beta-lysylation protein EpmB [Pseudomonadales bacterium]
MITRTDPSCQTQNTVIRLDEVKSWQQLLSGSTLTLAELLQKLDISAADFANSIDGDPDTAALDFPIRAPAPFIERMVKGDINDPLLRQVLPLVKEHDITPGYTTDPLQEADFNSIPGLIHKYRSRALFIVTKACAIHCRYCFRRHFPYEDNQPSREMWSQALDYLEQHPDINEVIYSGGDPLASSNAQLNWLSQRIAKIPHIKTLRIHTRLPVVLPQRIDSALLELLQQWPGKKVIVIHSNHANEIDDSVKDAIDKLKLTGATILNQTVLLKGINDSSSALVELSERLFDVDVLPYYLHLLDSVTGAAHFAIDDTEAKTIMAEVVARLPGYLVPRLVREEANKQSKTLILPRL